MAVSLGLGLVGLEEEEVVMSNESSPAGLLVVVATEYSMWSTIRRVPYVE